MCGWAAHSVGLITPYPPKKANCASPCLNNHHNPFRGEPFHSIEKRKMSLEKPDNEGEEPCCFN